jgi:hypothetical protein
MSSNQSSLPPPEPNQTTDTSVTPPASGLGSGANPYAGTALGDSWQQGFADGSAEPDEPHPPPSPLTPDNQTAYSEGVLAGQQAARPAPASNQSSGDKPPDPATQDPQPEPTKSEGDSGTKDTLIDIAKSKGLVAAGEAIAGKAGGIIGYAIDLATSPGGDTSLSHTIYQAIIMPDDVPVPGAQWHRKRENAEKDAKEYTARTGRETSIEEQFSKDDDPE